MTTREYNQLPQRDRRLVLLMLNHGYAMRNNNREVWSRAIAWIPARFFLHCRDIFDAAGQLVPLIHSEDYAAKWREITKES